MKNKLKNETNNLNPSNSSKNSKNNLNILLIDNYDSFTYNLVDEFEKRNCNVKVYRNDVSIDEFDNIIKKFNPSLIVISPGPASPKDAGNCINIIKKYYTKIPIFGVCLGHQCIVEAFDGKVSRAKETVHGKSSDIIHDNKSIYKNLENPLSVGRYHSLTGTIIPDSLIVTSKTSNELVMGVRLKENKYFVEGVQFHPESILTSNGGILIENLIGIIRNKCGKK